MTLMRWWPSNGGFWYFNDTKHLFYIVKRDEPQDKVLCVNVTGCDGRPVGHVEWRERLEFHEASARENNKLMRLWKPGDDIDMLAKIETCRGGNWTAPGSANQDEASDGWKAFLGATGG